MKGKMKRGEKKEEEERKSKLMIKEKKKKEEKRMIVEMLRKDIQMVREVGYIEVKEILRVE